MSTTITLEIELEVEFNYTPGTPADYWHPGDPAEVCIRAVRFGNHEIPINCFCKEDQEAIEEAALCEAEGFEPEYN